MPTRRPCRCASLDRQRSISSDRPGDRAPGRECAQWSGAQEVRQAQQKKVHVEGGIRITPRYDLVDRRLATHQPGQFRLTFHDNSARSLFLELPNVAHKLKRVTQALLAAKQNGPARQRFALPDWLAERVNGMIGPTASPLVFLPPVEEITLQEQEVRAVVASIHVVGLQGKSSFVVGLRFREQPLDGQYVRQVVVRLGNIRLELDGTPIVGHGFVEPALLATNDAEKIVRLGMVRLETHRFRHAGLGLVIPFLLGEANPRL